MFFSLNSSTTRDSIWTTSKRWKSNMSPTAFGPLIPFGDLPLSDMHEHISGVYDETEITNKKYQKVTTSTKVLCLGILVLLMFPSQTPGHTYISTSPFLGFFPSHLAKTASLPYRCRARTKSEKIAAAQLRSDVPNTSRNILWGDSWMYPTWAPYEKSLYKPYITWVFMGDKIPKNP